MGSQRQRIDDLIDAHVWMRRKSAGATRQMPGKAHPTVRELRVVFDTNPLHTQVPSDLVNAETRALILANSAHPDLKIKWLLPEVVVSERQYQMQQQALELLPNFHRVNAILGIGISISPDTLLPKIASVIDAELTELGIEKLPLNHAQVDWQKIVNNAAFRQPPFQPGKNEKGFRDAMILETFAQLVEVSPTSAARCRLALVTNDGRLTVATKDRIGTFTNAEVLPGLEELRNLINTLISSIDETFIKELREKANKVFFVQKQAQTLYYREKIGNVIRAKFSDELNELPDGATTREADGVLIAAPRFLKKERQRVHWSSQVSFKSNAYQFVAAARTLSEVMSLGNIQNQPDYFGSSHLVLNTPKANTPIYGLGALVGLPQTSLFDTVPETTKTLVKKGRTVFDVAWSTTVDKNKKLTRPKIDDISFVETTWSD
jgi:hypothetical protein